MEEIFYHNFIRVRVRQHTRTAPNTDGTTHGRHRIRTAPHTDGSTRGRHRARTALYADGTAYGQANAPHITRMYTIDELMDVGPVAHT